MNSVIRLTVVLTLSTTVLLVLLYAFTKDWQKSGLILSFFMLLFLTYGHIHGFRDVSVGGFQIFRHKYLLIVWFMLGMGGAILISRIKNLSSFTKFANTMSIVLLLFPLINIGFVTTRENLYKSRAESQPSSPSGLSITQPAPDVYFIVLDAYGRADVLQDLSGYDNSEFIRELQDMGFYVVDCSQSNYARTKLSIASTLNMDYIQNLVPDYDTTDVNLWSTPLLLDNQVRNLFEGLGYKTIAFYNGYKWLHWKDADYFLQPEAQQSAFSEQLDANLSSFEEMFLNTTLFSFIIDSQTDQTQLSSAPSRRESDLYALATLPKIPQIAGPKFIYAHVVLPHPPFIFGPNGENVNIGRSDEDLNDVTQYKDEANRLAYRDQVIYTNNRIIPILREIIEKSPTPPIIVLESDHGPTAYGGVQNRMGNFMAYYFPGKDIASLARPSISPVNSFRLLFNTYFNGNYPLLDDVSYYSDVTYNFDYQIVPNTCP